MQNFAHPQLATPTDHNVTLFFCGTAVAVIVCAITVAGWKHKLLIWGLLGLAAALFVLAFTWETVSAALPVFGSAITSVATTGTLSFLAIVTALVVACNNHLKMRRLGNAAQPDASEAGDLRRAFEVLREEFNEHKTHMETCYSAQDKARLEGLNVLGERLTRAEQRFGSVEGNIMGAIKRVEAQRSLDGDYFRQQVASLYNSLGAIFHRERLESLAIDIEAKAEELSAPTSMEMQLDEDLWEWWQGLHTTWKGIVFEWVNLAGCYAPGIEGKVLDVHPDQLQQKGKAKSSQFPDAEAFITYKGFWIVLKQWRDWRQEAERAVHQVAFNGGTAGSRPIFPGGGEMEELGAKNSLSLRFPAAPDGAG
jgi:hypothetical protein